MERIDSAKVAEWFKAHPDIEPTRDFFVAFDDDDRDGDEPAVLVNCCGLTSQIADDHPNILDELIAAGTHGGASLIASRLGLADVYAFGFANGWDASNLLRPVEFDGRYQDGHEDGTKAWALTLEAIR